MERRSVLRALASSSALVACRPDPRKPIGEERRDLPAQSAPTVSSRKDSVMRRVLPLTSPFPTLDPFLFCAHHRDDYPKGNAELGPAVSLAGRRLGSDFSGQDGFSMYHGGQVPGFPEHPHRGFETITFVQHGLVDHSDSLGAAARYGNGDVQWLTAGGGIVHAEMFPLLSQQQTNPLKLFQIWLNLPKKDKFVPPHFSMFWADQVPSFSEADPAGRVTTITLVAGALGSRRGPTPPPSSYGSRPQSDLLIALLRLHPGARFVLPVARPGSHRMLYVTAGEKLSLGRDSIHSGQAAEVDPSRPTPLQAGRQEVEVLVLQGRPLGEPVARRGPFVMNSADEIREAYVDYEATGFGGWPWASRAPVHGPSNARFARHADGRLEHPT